MMRTLAFLFLATISLAACQTTIDGVSAQSNPHQRWVGVMAVTESPLVNRIIVDHGNDPARYGPVLRAALDAGHIQPAPGRYCFVPYTNGRPDDRPECVTTSTGVYTMWAPAYMVQSGRAMCVQVPPNWPAIAGQRRYPAVGGRSVNCYDFDNTASSRDFAATRQTAAMVVVVAPRN
jgi:hypothetical protein